MRCRRWNNFRSLCSLFSLNFTFSVLLLTFSVSHSLTWAACIWPLFNLFQEYFVSIMMTANFEGKKARIRVTFRRWLFLSRTSMKRYTHIHTHMNRIYAHTGLGPILLLLLLSDVTRSWHVCFLSFAFNPKFHWQRHTCTPSNNR